MGPLEGPSRRARRLRALVLAAGLVLPQAVLYGPSLVGARVLMAVDTLAMQGFYLPRDGPHAAVVPENAILTDPVLVYAPRRMFVNREVRDGRLPLWNPYNFCGSPLLMNLYSPFEVPLYLWLWPGAIAWVQVLKALFTGWGAYLFLRRVSRVGFPAAAVAACLWPHSGYLVQWALYVTGNTALWLPWILLATEAAVRRPARGGPALAAATALMMLDGLTGTGGILLLASGLWFVGRAAQVHGRSLLGAPGLRSVATVVSGWVLGLALAGPAVLPAAAYLGTSARAAARGGGAVEAPGAGLGVLPQVVMPYIHGDSRKGTYYLGGSGNRLESASSAYAGLLAALVLAPLGLAHRPRRGLHLVCLALAVFGLGQVAALPLLSEAYRHFPLTLLRNNRLVMLTAFSTLVLAASGLEALSGGRRLWRWWFAPAALALLALAWWCWTRERGEELRLVADYYRVSPAGPMTWFDRMHRAYALLAALGAAAWLALAMRGPPAPWLRRGLAGTALAEVVVSAWGVNPQCEAALYYPPIRVLGALAAADPPGRMCGVYCLNPNLNLVAGLRDVRGHDGADPLPLIRLLRIANPSWDEQPDYSVTIWYPPTDSPILDMLNLRYWVLRGKPPPGVVPWDQGEDYWVLEKPSALPRAWVPRRVEHTADAEATLAALAAPGFDPREVAYVEGPGALPPLAAPAAGEARIAQEDSATVRIELAMRTPGLVVISDLWYPGWRALVDGGEVEVLCVNHALRGVPVEAASRVLEFRYSPPSLRAGLWAMGAALAALGTWVWLGLGRRAASVLHAVILSRLLAARRRSP